MATSFDCDPEGNSRLEFRLFGSRVPERASLAPRLLGLWRALERGSDFVAQFSDDRSVLRRPLCLPLLLHEIENLARGDERGDRGRGEKDDDEQRAVPARTLAQSALCTQSWQAAELDDLRRRMPHWSSESVSASS